ncbi:MAG: tetratricopeptide repeat protein [Thermodesulfobacteriota bacterium]
MKVIIPAVCAAVFLFAPAHAETPGGLFARGYRHLTGQGTQRDATLAAKFFLEAAQTGEPQSQFQLGVMFMDGLGLPRDNLWAWFWLDKAASSPALPEEARQAAKGRLDALGKILTADEKRRLGIRN